MIRAPHVTLAVAEYFDGLFPDRCPSEADSERQIWMAAGAARVVKKMQQIANRQANNVIHEDVLDGRDVSGDD